MWTDILHLLKKSFSLNGETLATCYRGIRAECVESRHSEKRENEGMREKR